MPTVVTLAVIYWTIGFASWLYIRRRDEGRLVPFDFFAGIFLAFLLPVFALLAVFYVAWVFRGADEGR